MPSAPRASIGLVALGVCADTGHAQQYGDKVKRRIVAEGGEVSPNRRKLPYTGPDGKTWWVAKDVCAVLELDDVRRATERLDEDERSLTPLTDALGRAQQTYIVSEPGLFGLILAAPTTVNF